MILSDTQKVQVILAGAITTSQLAVAASWAEIKADGSTFAPDNIEINTNSTTAVDVVAVATSGYKRQVKEIAIYNADTAAATVTVRVDTSGTPRIRKKVTLQTGEQLQYCDTLGWRVFGADGAERAGAASIADGDRGDITVSGSGATWTLDADVIATIRTIPQNSQSAAYTLVLADAGKHIYHPAADTTARIWTIPANSSVAFPIGSAVTFDNDFGAGAITIAITTDTLVLVGTVGSTGSRTLASGGQATAVKVTSTRWRISGIGLT